MSSIGTGLQGIYYIHRSFIFNYLLPLTTIFSVSSLNAFQSTGLRGSIRLDVCVMAWTSCHSTGTRHDASWNWRCTLHIGRTALLFTQGSQIWSRSLGSFGSKKKKNPPEKKDRATFGCAYESDVLVSTWWLRESLMGKTLILSDIYLFPFTFDFLLLQTPLFIHEWTMTFFLRRFCNAISGDLALTLFPPLLFLLYSLRWTCQDKWYILALSHVLFVFIFIFIGYCLFFFIFPLFPPFFLEWLQLFALWQNGTYRTVKGTTMRRYVIPQRRCIRRFLLDCIPPSPGVSFFWGGLFSFCLWSCQYCSCASV